MILKIKFNQIRDKLLLETKILQIIMIIFKIKYNRLYKHFRTLIK
jgi:hypothetical protein